MHFNVTALFADCNSVKAQYNLFVMKMLMNEPYDNPQLQMCKISYNKLVWKMESLFTANS